MKRIFSLRKLKAKDLALISLFIAIQIILTRFCSIQTPIVRLDFNFLAVCMCAVIFGPIWGGIAAAIADVIGVMLFPVGGFFPGFTLSMFLMGFTYGAFLYNKEKTYLRISIPVLIVCLGISLSLDTLWVMIITGKAFLALLPVRLTKAVIMIPTQILLIHWFWNLIGQRVSGFISSYSHN